MKKYFCFLFLYAILYGPVTSQNLPDGFVDIKDVIPDVVLDIRYAGKNNFIGEPITGYNKARAIITEPAANALEKVQQDLNKQGFGLKVFDAYRPQRAVNRFIQWAKDPADTLKKQEFYPEVDKKDLFELGYIASRSGHSRGSTPDLTIIDAETKKELDMGSPYDLFGEISHHNSPKITAKQKQNRELLKQTMMKYGFQPYAKEWWHYTYQPEPYPDNYFDFVVDR